VSSKEQYADYIAANSFRAVTLGLGYPINSRSVALESSRIALSGAGRLFGFSGYSNKGATQFIQVFDAVGVPADGAIPELIINVASSPWNFGAYFGSVGRWFQRGIVLCNSSTAATKTIGSADCWFDVQVM